MQYTMSETKDGRFIVQRENFLGGLYPVVPHSENCRHTKEVFEAIYQDWIHNYPENCDIEFRPYGHPQNAFNQEAQ